MGDRPGKAKRDFKGKAQPRASPGCILSGVRHWRSHAALKVTAWAIAYGNPEFKTHRSRTVISRFVTGVVQVPAGRPIVFDERSQTTGGYPRIACIIEADMYHLAQIPARSADSFCPVFTGRGTEARQQDQQRWLRTISVAAAMKIDLNADLGEGCASDAEAINAGFPLPILPQWISCRRCANHAGLRA